MGTMRRVSLLVLKAGAVRGPVVMLGSRSWWQAVSWYRCGPYRGPRESVGPVEGCACRLAGMVGLILTAATRELIEADPTRRGNLRLPRRFPAKLRYSEPRPAH